MAHGPFSEPPLLPTSVTTHYVLLWKKTLALTNCVGSIPKADWEQRAVMVEGYLLDAVKEKPESCKCGSPDYVDHHLWLAATPTASKALAIVVEVSPRSWPTNPTWRNTRAFTALVRAKSKVRIAGWLTWDEEHESQVGKSRRTLWEVHPIHQIQVPRGNQWLTI